MGFRVPSITTAILINALALSGCASIVSGTQQSVSVVAQKPDSSAVSGVSCSFTNGKGQWFAPAPGSVTVHRAYSPLVVQCEHPDWVGGAEVKSSTKPMAFGNILLGGVIGAGVDIGTGAAYDYPQLITVPMKARTSPLNERTVGTGPASELTLVQTSTAALPVSNATVAAVQSSPVAVPAPSEQSARAIAIPPLALERPSLVRNGPLAAAAAQPVVQEQAPSNAISAESPQIGPLPIQGLKGGQHSFYAARVARDSACHSQPTAIMTAKGPGFENYSVACANGEALAIRCDFGNCRILR